MKTLTWEEIAEISVKSKGGQTDISANIMKLAVGEALLISPSDWTRPNPPYYLAHYVAKTQGKKFKNGQVRNGGGWLIHRIH